MGWSTAFKDRLSRRTPPRFVLSVVESVAPGTAYRISSHPFPGETIDPTLVMAGLNFTGANLYPRQGGPWKATFTSFTARVVGDVSVFLSHVTRGTLLQLQAGYDDQALADYQTVIVGVFNNIRSFDGGPSWELETLDLWAVLKFRLYTTIGANYVGEANTTELVGAYTVGDTSITVLNQGGFDRETGQDGLVLVRPSTGSPFYLRYSGKATGPDRLTGLTADVHGTTAVDAVGGDTVESCFYVRDNPVDFVRKLFVSTGAGTNGAYDVLPESWGLAVDNDWLDHDDLNDVKTMLTGAASPYNWEVVSADPITDAGPWLLGMLSRAGLFIVQRQGRLTLRYAQDTATATPVMDVTDQDIYRVLEWEAYDFSFNPEYSQVIVSTSDGSDSLPSPVDTATLPNGNEYDFNLADLVFDNGTDIATEVLGRVAESCTRVPEKLTLLCAGLRLAQLAVGDVISLTTVRAWSRRDGRAGFTSRPALVTSVTAKWTEMAVILAVVIYPESEDAFA